MEKLSDVLFLIFAPYEGNYSIGRIWMLCFMIESIRPGKRMGHWSFRIVIPIGVQFENISPAMSKIRGHSFEKIFI